MRLGAGVEQRSRKNQFNFGANPGRSFSTSFTQQDTDVDVDYSLNIKWIFKRIRAYNKIKYYMDLQAQKFKHIYSDNIN